MGKALWMSGSWTERSQPHTVMTLMVRPTEVTHLAASQVILTYHLGIDMQVIRGSWMRKCRIKSFCLCKIFQANKLFLPPNSHSRVFVPLSFCPLIPLKLSRLCYVRMMARKMKTVKYPVNAVSSCWKASPPILINFL